MIKGGFYIKARCIQDSKISYAPPHVREIWDWLIKEANHEETKICSRGQCIRTYKDIINGLSWMVGWRKMSYTKAQCENAMKYLTRNTMIATKKTTRGLIITVLNYDKYQDVNNYKQTTKATMKPTGEPQSCHTINNNDNNERRNKEITTYISSFNEKFKTNYQITSERVKKLNLRLKTFTLEDVLKALDNLSKSKFHQGDNDRGWKADPDFLIRSDEQIDKWVNYKSESISDDFNSLLTK